MTSMVQPAETGPVAARVLQALPVLAPATTPMRRLASPARRIVALRVAADVLASVAALGTVALMSAPLPVAAMAALPLVWLGFLGIAGTHHAGIGRQRAVARGTLQAGGVLGLGCWVATTLTAFPVPSSDLLLLTTAVTLGSLAGRTVVDAWAVRAASRVRVVLAGDQRQVVRALDELRRDPRHGFDVVAVCLREAETHALGELPVTIGFEHLADLATATAGAVIVLPDSQLEPAELRFLGWQLESSGTELYLGTGLLDTSPARTVAANAGGLHLLHVRTSTRWNARRLVKAAWESAAALLGLALLLPLFATLVVLIRVSSPGPAIFRQARVGRGGRTFTMYKFRTMVPDAEIVGAELADNDADGVLFKLRVDPRVTPVGRVLRRYSLDELPQLINVAIGQMALVGPRPALPGEVERYDHDPRRRLAVRPGLTGLWQVSGRSDLSWEQSVRLDLFYVDNWSLGLDLSILRRTIRAVLGHHGAY
jgi:exopolysaccharide biosynthesis polyprenyl glycosylphosphotransferase